MKEFFEFSFAIFVTHQEKEKGEKPEKPQH